MNPIDRMMSWAQIILSVVFLVLVFIVIGAYELGYASKLTPDQQRVFGDVLSFLKDAALVILYFWFQRQRQGGIPDGPTVTQTQIGPDGSKVSVTSPAHLPLPTLPNPIQPATPAKS